MRFLTDFADQAVVLPMVAVIAVALALQGWRRGTLVWLAVALATFGLMLVLKLVCLVCTPVLGRMGIHSPSGHVAAAAMVCGGLAALLTHRRADALTVAVCAAVVIGVSRLALGMHSLPEVALGAVVGLAGAAALPALAGPPPPTLRPGHLLAVGAIVVMTFHGLHLPAEAAIRQAALTSLRRVAVCRLEQPLAKPATTLPPPACNAGYGELVPAADLPPRPRSMICTPREVGGGRAPRQPGQVRKEAAATSFRSGRCPISHLSAARPA